MVKEIDWSKFNGIQFYDIQKQIISENKEKTGVFLGTGLGKTLTCLVLAQRRTLIVCPKQQKLDRTWQKNNEKFNLGKDITVISKEEFRRDWDILDAFDTVIFDEAHNMFGVLPETRQRNKVQIPKTSQIFEAAYMYLRKHPPGRFYLATATPASKPMNVWAIAKLLGKDWDFFRFRSTFYFPAMMGRRQIWLPKTDSETKQRLALAVQKMGYTGSLSDFLDVPEQKHLMPTDGSLEYIELSDEQKKAIKHLNETEADPMVRRSRIRTIENGILYGKKVIDISEKESEMIKNVIYYKNNKIEYILNKAQEFPKLLIFATYTAQIMAIAKALEDEGYKVYTVTSATKDRDTVFEEAERAEKVIVVAQASICEGYRVPSVPCMIFASKSNRYVHYVQALGRILDGQHLKKNLYIHLVTKDGPDESCHQAMMDGKDFEEMLSVL